MAIPFRGATAVGNGKHILTGPIYICDAQPGDKVKVRGHTRDNVLLPGLHLAVCCCNLT